jgi:hypothetical protein
VPAAVDCAAVLAVALAGAAPSEATADLAALAPICAAWPAAASQLAYAESEGFEGRLAALSGGSGVLEEAFVAFVSGAPSGGYAELMTEALAAAAEHSQRPVVLFACGAVGEGGAPARLWPPGRFPRLAVLSLYGGVLHPWFDKLRAALLAPVRRAVILEADSLATWHVDRLFAVLAREPRYALPLLPVHMHLRWPECEVRDGLGVTRIAVALAEGDTRLRACGAPYATPVANRSTPYGHSAAMVYTSASKAFLAEILLACGLRDGERLGIDCDNDEVALNTALWRKGARRQLCLIDPQFNTLDAWAAASWSVPTIAAGRAESFQTHSVAYAFVHGEKAPDAARAIAARVRALPRGASWVCDRGRWISDAELVDGWRGAGGCEL